MIENVINFYKLNEHWLCKLVFCLSLLFSFSFLFLLPFLVSSFCRPLVSSSPLGKVFTNTPRIYKYFKDSTWVLVNQFFFLWMTQDLIILFGHDVSGTRNMHLNCFNDSQTLIILSKRSNTKKVKTNKHSHLFFQEISCLFSLQCLGNTLGARDFSCTVSSFGHVFVVTQRHRSIPLHGVRKSSLVPRICMQRPVCLTKIEMTSFFFFFRHRHAEDHLCTALQVPIISCTWHWNQWRWWWCWLGDFTLHWKWHSAMLTI